MSINIETSTTLQLTTEQIDILAHYLCGVRRSLNDDNILFSTSSISLNTVNALADSCYGDSKEALLEKGVNISVNKVYQRVLDSVILQKLLNTFQHSESGVFTVAEFLNISTFTNSMFNNNKTITEFLELPHTSVTTLPGNCFKSTSILRIDLTGITRIDSDGFCGNTCELINASLFFSGLVSIDRTAFQNTTFTNVVQMVCENLELVNGWSYEYNSSAFPKGMSYIYLPKCTLFTGKTIANMTNGLVYAPALLSWTEASNSGTPWDNDPKLISIGELFTDLTCVQPLKEKASLQPSALLPTNCIVFHGDSFLLSGSIWNEFLSNQYKNYVKTFVTPVSRQSFLSQLSSSGLQGFQTSGITIYTIGFLEWQQSMQKFANIHEYTLPSEYTDWSYEYIDYLIGNTPLPNTQLDQPTNIQLADLYGILSNNDNVSNTSDLIEIHAVVNSYRNVCTYELLENNAGVTISGNMISVPSTANGQSVTIKATSTYDNSVSAQVTINIYSTANVSTNKCNAKTQQILLQYYYPNKRYLTDSDITAITVLPGRIFKNETGLGNANWLKYTNVVRGSSIYEYSDLDCFAGSDITSISFPDTIDNIPRGCCIDCPNLTIVEFPQTSFSIPYGWTFGSCQALTTVENLSNVVCIANKSFYQCYNLEYFGGAGSTAGELNLPNLTHLGESSFLFCRKLKTIVDLGNITRIKSGAFLGCTELLSIVVPDSVTVVETSAFAGCGKLTTVSLPEGLDEINAYVFLNCSALTRLTIPSTVTKLSGNYGLVDRCNNLQELVFLGTTPPTINQSGLLYGTPNTCKIYVPDSSISAYETAIGVKNSGLVSRITPLSQLPT